VIDDPVVLYRVDAIDRRTMRAQGVAVLARTDIEAFEAIRKDFPRHVYDIVDRETGELVDLDGPRWS
jgi:hypothetical protein